MSDSVLSPEEQKEKLIAQVCIFFLDYETIDRNIHCEFVILIDDILFFSLKGPQMILQ